MSLEQEIKLIVPHDERLDFASLAWLQPYFISAPIQQHLISTYFDTPKFELYQYGVGLRIRKVGEQWLQTVKSTGQAIDGLHQREEWEQAIEDDQFDMALLKQTRLAPLVDDETVWPNLADVFTTDFVRLQYDLALEQGTLVELAYDVGEVRSGAKQNKIHEVELELKQGELAVMVAFAEKLKSELNLRYSDTSKAAMGYQLFLTC